VVVVVEKAEERRLVASSLSPLLDSPSLIVKTRVEKKGRAGKSDNS
jgi:hypothetical protein